MKSFFLIFFFILSASSLDSQNQSIEINTSWQFKQRDKTDWLAATVPGNVFTDLLNNKLIKDPFYADNVKESRWVEKKDWEYRTTIQCDANVLKNQHLDLIFEGLDTHASIYINDSLLLKTNNMFRSWQLDSKKYLHLGSNELRVVFESAVIYGQREAAKLPYVLPEEERIFSRKAQFQYGWDFSPRFVSCGIWKPIKLVTWNDLKINSTHYKIISQNDSLAVVNFVIESLCESPGEYKFTLTETPKNGNTSSILNKSFSKKLIKGVNTDTLKLSIAQPKLWWCNGMGEAFLYNFLISIENKKQSIRSSSLSVGIRKIELVKEIDSDGVSFYFKLNDVPVFMKGANYVPDDVFLLPKKKSDYTTEMNGCKKSNMNMLRVWGGGVYPDEDFYAACDQAGILVWQDLMFACAMYPGDTGFINNVKKEIKEQLVRLRNHASLALWCGNNEIDEAWHNWGWQKQFKYSLKDSVKIWKDYENLFLSSVSELMQTYCPDMPYWPSSPSVGWGHQESLTRGDSHYWGVWWGMEPFEVYQKKIGRFMSEYGFQSLPALSSFKKFTPDSQLNLNSATVKAHQKHPKGFQTIQTYLERAYKKPQTFENYIYISQLLQRDGMQMAIEAHRRNKPLCMGTLFWQLNDSWPSISWSAIDYFKQPKAFSYALRDLYRSQAVSIVNTDSAYVVYTVSDSLINFGAKLTVKLLNFRSEMIWQKNYPIMLSNTKVFRIKISKSEIPTFDSSQCYLKVEINSSGKPLLTKFHFFTTPKQCSLPRANIGISMIDPTTLELSSDVFAKDVFVFDEQEELIFSDNFFNLEAGQKKRIYLNSKNKTLNNTNIKSIVLNNL